MGTENSNKELSQKQLATERNKKGEKQLKRKNNESSDSEDEQTTYDEKAVNDVLAEQEFPTRKISKKKKKESENKESPKNEQNDNPPAIEYLLQWKNNKKNWKFKKLRQTWLLQNIYLKEKVSKENFKVLLEYLSELKGLSREQTLEKARTIVEEEEEADKRRYKRALKVLKLLT